jgi:UDP-3-O-[3-hydroxymyristoyl] N-acetylglucosamine deacetylase
MKTLRKQRTISRPAEVTGFGYWSGKDVRVEFRPASPQSGIVFVRGDLERPRRIPVAVENRIEIPRRTALAADGAQVEMVEHILAALYGLSIDNCEIWVDGPEMPGCDGSSQPFVAALDAVGVVEQGALRRQLVVAEITRVGDDDCWIEARPLPAGRLSVKYKLDYGQNNPIGKQAIEVPISAASFRQELAPARTFIFQEEADWLRQRGLGTRVTNQDLLVFGPDGVLDNELRFDNECVRHKALDLLGDLSLAGCDLAGQFTAYKSGHRLNAELVKVLLKEGQMEQGLRRTG